MANRTPRDKDGQPHQVKREPRKKRVLVAEMRPTKTKPQLIVIINLSDHGARCRAVLPPEVDDRIDVQLDSFGLFGATVRWRDGSYFGVSFEEPIDLIAIMLSRTGFRTSDYAVPLTPEFEAVLMSELFRSGEFS